MRPAVPLVLHRLGDAGDVDEARGLVMTRDLSEHSSHWTAEPYARLLSAAMFQGALLRGQLGHARRTSTSKAGHIARVGATSHRHAVLLALRRFGNTGGAVSLVTQGARARARRNTSRKLGRLRADMPFFWRYAVPMTQVRCCAVSAVTRGGRARVRYIAQVGVTSRRHAVLLALRRLGDAGDVGRVHERLSAGGQQSSVVAQN